MDNNIDLLNNWFQNSEEMLSKTMQDLNLNFYPSNSENLRVFDFYNQKISMDKDDDFYSVDQKIATNQKGKKNNQKKLNATDAKKQYGKNKLPVQQSKFRILQTIQIKQDWKLIADYNKQSLDKLRLENNTVEFEDLSL